MRRNIQRHVFALPEPPAFTASSSSQAANHFLSMEKLSHGEAKGLLCSWGSLGAEQPGVLGQGDRHTYFWPLPLDALDPRLVEERVIVGGEERVLKELLPPQALLLQGGVALVLVRLHRGKHPSPPALGGQQRRSEICRVWPGTHTPPGPKSYGRRPKSDG